jgi:hypothetical protein
VRVALFSDVHGNAVALAAVLTAIRRESPDVVAFLGDAVLRVPMPAETMALLRSLPHIAVRGNYDWMLAVGLIPGSPVEVQCAACGERSALGKRMGTSPLVLLTPSRNEQIDSERSRSRH